MLRGLRRVERVCRAPAVGHDAERLWHALREILNALLELASVGRADVLKAKTAKSRSPTGSKCNSKLFGVGTFAGSGKAAVDTIIETSHPSAPGGRTVIGTVRFPRMSTLALLASCR